MHDLPTLYEVMLYNDVYTTNTPPVRPKKKVIPHTHTNSSECVLVSGGELIIYKAA